MMLEKKLTMIVRILLVIILLGSLMSGFAISDRCAEAKTMAETWRDVDDIKELAKRFSADLASGKDLEHEARNSLTFELFDHFLEDENRYPFIPVGPHALSQLTQNERRHYYLLMVNLHYLTGQYAAGSFLFGTGFDKTTRSAGRYPRKVMKLLRKDKTLAAAMSDRDGNFPEITSVGQLRRMIPVLERSVVEMKTYLKEHPSKRSRTYERNMAYLKTKANLFEPWTTTCEQCFGLPKGTEQVNVNVPFLQLSFLRVGSELKLFAVTPYIQ